MARRPNQVPIRPPLTNTQISSATYVGSPEHKVIKWWGGLPMAHIGANGKASRPKKEDTSICHLTSKADQNLATNLVQAALNAGQFRFREGDKDFPSRIWYRDNVGQAWEGYCINSIQGKYKGWPLTEDEFIAL